MNFRIGDADSEQVAFVVNAELPISDTVALYSFATYSDRKNQSAGFYRRANQYDRTVASIYPDGFLPLINTNIEDYSLTSGVFIDMGSFQFDLSGSYGANSFNFYISNSLNASLGESSPTEADAGTLEVSQTILTIDAVKSLELAGREASFAFGAEYRQEGYKLIAGEPASYIDGGAVNTACPGCEIEPVRYQSGFQVFRGFSPQNEVDADRQNTAFYLDLEVEPSDNWLVASAVRYEDYSDFGSKLTGKISSRYRVSDGLSFRGSLSTGFRAPSIQQINFNSVSTQFVEIGGETVAQERGTFQHDSLVAHLVGLPELKEETSFNASAGFVATGNGFTLTADYYHVEIDDRIGISGAINLTQPTFSNVSVSASSAQFFVNAADTKTDGLDLVASYKVPMPEGQALLFNAAANWTRTKVVDESVATTIGGVDVGPLITAQDISIIEDWQPKSRINFGVQYSVSNWDFTSRLSRYGSYTVCEGACDTMENTQTFSAKWLADVQVSYRFPVNGLSVSIGVNNLFDTTPDKNLIGQARGGEILGIVSSPGVFQYSRRSAPFGFNGGYWYARASMRF
jgi:iron complex outermembrane receptor protein